MSVATTRGRTAATGPGEASVSDVRRRRGARLRFVGHILTAAVLALKGVAKLDHPEGHGLLIGACFASAAIILTVTALHSKLHAHAAEVEALIYLLEATVAGAMAVVTVQEGKRGLPFAWAIAAAGLLMGGWFGCGARAKRLGRISTGGSHETRRRADLYAASLRGIGRRGRRLGRPVQRRCRWSHRGAV